MVLIRKIEKYTIRQIQVDLVTETCLLALFGERTFSFAGFFGLFKGELKVAFGGCDGGFFDDGVDFLFESFDLFFW
jgi:hypothetical protein